MFTDIVHTAPKRLTIAPSVEAICLFCAAGLAVSAIIIPFLPAEAVAWALVHIG